VVWSNQIQPFAQPAINFRYCHTSLNIARINHPAHQKQLRLDTHFLQLQLSAAVKASNILVRFHFLGITDKLPATEYISAFPLHPVLSSVLIENVI